jgi:hypothetical protein
MQNSDLVGHRSGGNAVIGLILRQLEHLRSILGRRTSTPSESANGRVPYFRQQAWRPSTAGSIFVRPAASGSGAAKRPHRREVSKGRQV